MSGKTAEKVNGLVVNVRNVMVHQILPVVYLNMMQICFLLIMPGRTIMQWASIHMHKCQHRIRTRIKVREMRVTCNVCHDDIFRWMYLRSVCSKLIYNSPCFFVWVSMVMIWLSWIHLFNSKRLTAPVQSFFSFQTKSIHATFFSCPGK